MTIGQRLELRCFMEGIEVPIISASLTINMDAPSQCQIQLPATDAIMKLKPRTLVHVFYYDYWGGPSDSISARPLEASESQAMTAQELARQQSANDGDDTQGAASTNLTTAGLNSPNVRSRTTSTANEEQGVAEAATESQAVVAGQGSTTAGPVQSGSQHGPNEAEELEWSIEVSENWRLYFIGEVVGIQFSKSAASRSVILNCMDNSLYWDTCYQYKVNVSRLTGNGQANFVGAGTTLFDTFFESGESTLAQAMQQTPISQPELKGLLAGVVTLLERVGGVYRRGRRNISGVNDFFTIAELRLKLVYQITAASEDFSSQRVLNRRAYHWWGRRQAGRLGEISSFREIVNLMNKFIFHNVVPCPIAKYEPPLVEERTRVRTGTTSLADTNRGRSIVQRINSRIQVIEAFIGRINSSSPSQANRIALTSYADAQTIEQDLNSIGATDAAAPVVGAKLALGRARASTRTRLTQLSMSEAVKSAVQSDLETAVLDLSTAKAALEGNTRNYRRRVTTTHHLGNRLHSQIIRPDIYFVSPPRCNVLFPELYSQVDYSRGFMQEVTRMRLTVTDEIFGDDILLNNCYYAPDVAIVGQRRRSQLGTGAREHGSRDNSVDRTLSHAAYSRRLMDHELYVGIIPTFERMNEVNIYGNRTDTVVQRGARIPFVTRAVNHQFYKHRFMPRTMNAAGKFNPSAVCGFPALVLDRYLNTENTQLVTGGFFSRDFFEELWAAGRRDTEAANDGTNSVTFLGEQSQALQEAWDTLRAVTPTQYLGMVSSLTHTVAQNQASTSYSMQYARTHNENEELLGANNVRVARRAPGRSPTRRTIVAATSEPREGMVGPYHGIITEVEPVNRSGQFILFGTYAGRRPRRQQTRVTVGLTQAARLYGPEVTVLMGDPDIEVTFNSYRITESIARWSGDTVDVPLEDFIRPPWMSDIWRNDRIGAVYHQFFGVGSITDPLSVAVGPEESPVTDASSTTSANDLDSTAQARRESRTITRTGTGEQANTGLPGDMSPDSIGDAEAEADGSTIQSTLTDINVERAVNLLTRIYSSVKHNGLDIHEFIRAYTWRPVATLTNILGSYDLEIDENGRVTAGVEGFHSRAFGHGDAGQDLRNLINPDDNEIRTLLRIRPNNDRDNVLNRLDKRAEKAEVVMRYVAELWDSKGLLG